MVHGASVLREDGGQIFQADRPDRCACPARLESLTYVPDASSTIGAGGRDEPSIRTERLMPHSLGMYKRASDGPPCGRVPYLDLVAIGRGAQASSEDETAVWAERGA